MQVIKYKWLTSGESLQPFLFLKNKSKLERLPLLDQNHSFTLGKRLCVGYFKNGKHVACPEKRIVETGHCNECNLNDDYFFCMKCTGEECINEKQRNNCQESTYFVYLAAFNSLLKVGISYQFRLLERLIEQGADFAAKVAIVKDGKDVRTVEQLVSRHLGIVDRVAGAEKHKMLFCNPNTAVANIFTAIGNLQQSLVSKYLVPPEIYDLRNHYRLGNVKYNPKILSPKDDMKIEGKCVAAKGNLLVFKNTNHFFSLNAHDLIGRELNLVMENNYAETT